jgi:2-polyprenyl-3-methyl-5-hydroxy-6-metoxy-1,4-benzoquinol methylase
VREAPLVQSQLKSQCVICGAPGLKPRWMVGADGTEGGVDARSFRPSSQRFGETSGRVVMCSVCGHGALAESPDQDRVSGAYADATDEVSLRERAGQIATADRGLTRLELHVAPGRLLDVGCWTGSFVDAAKRRGWDASGVEPSAWAVGEARSHGLDVHHGELGDVEVPEGSLPAIVVCDVLEHLDDPGAAVARLAALLEPGGALYLTVPDAGSALARALGRRWWSVLPMHLQYFTRTSMLFLLAQHGLRPVHVSTHTKIFSARYYAERVAGYSTAVGRVAVATLARLGQADRPIAPDFRDRMEVIAVRR